MPTIAIPLSLLGVVPFVVFACGAVGQNPPTAEHLRDKFAYSTTADLVASVSADRMDTGEEALLELVQHLRVHRLVISAESGLGEGDMEDLLRTAKGIGIRITFFPGVFAMIGSSVHVEDLWGMPLLALPDFGLSRSSAALKRAFDVIGAAAGLVLLSPIFALTAIAIKLDSRGPMFFRQTRVGWQGRAFSIVKFRTMNVGAHEMRAAMKAELFGEDAKGLFKIVDDPRITRVGRWLRRTSLDELPQLINVLRGEMSLVGPRPLLADEDEAISGLDRRRLTIKPGMTGQWQVLGSSRVPLHEMVTLDYLYLANWSIWNDVKILLRTVTFVLERRGH